MTGRAIFCQKYIRAKKIISNHHLKTSRNIKYTHSIEEIYMYDSTKRQQKKKLGISSMTQTDITDKIMRCYIYIDMYQVKGPH